MCVFECVGVYVRVPFYVSHDYLINKLVVRSLSILPSKYRRIMMWHINNRAKFTGEEIWKMKSKTLGGKIYAMLRWVQGF